MKIRETPDRPWLHCSADYKGPIAGKYYSHVLMDNYSRWPEVAIGTSTSMDKLRKVLSDSFSVHGVPETITHDNGPLTMAGNGRFLPRSKDSDQRRVLQNTPKATG